MAEGYVQGQNFETRFVDVPLKEFDCPICLEILKNPFAIECCHHYFCNACINRVKQTKNECPLCKAQPIKGVLDKQFKQAINEATVYCSLRSAGCKWTGRYDALKNHLSRGQQNGQCIHVMVNCPHKKCDMTLPRHQIKNHAKGCKFRPFSCPHCGHKGIYTEVVEIHYQVCTQYPVPCPNCSKKIKYSELQHHLDTACPNTMVCCPFLDLGCKTKTKRSRLSIHIDSNSGQHRLLVSSTISELQKENKSQKESQSNLLGTTSKLEAKVSTLETKCNELEGNLFSMLHVHEENEAKRSKAVTELCEKNTILESSLSTLSSQHAQLRDDLSATCKENKQLKGTVSALESKCASLQSQFDKLKNQLTNNTRQATSVESRMKNLYDNCAAKMILIEEQLEQMTNTNGGGSCQEYIDGEHYSDDDDYYQSNSYHENSLQDVEEENAELRASLSALEAKYSSLEGKFSNVQDHLITLDEEVASAKQTVLQLLQGLEAKMVSLQSHTKERSQHTDIDYWMYGYKLMAKSMETSNWRLYLTTMAETATQLPEPVSPVILKLEGYKKVKENNTALLTSPFFTTGVGKYKFQLNVAIVSDPGHSRYMCVYAALLKGEYDSLLSWPFVGSIYVTLLNQVENDHHHKMAIWLPNSSTGKEVAGRVPSNYNNNQLWGQRQFISVRELEKTKQYIINDSLYFKVEATATKTGNSKDCIIS
ncbi:TNF receptor-associated factor 5-like [Dysidea avara]|uniref:TNF receptor-associated factor 5-like n=1 Tax=Dysidea avara TaxID=196820 RepID=UPI0033225927